MSESHYPCAYMLMAKGLIEEPMILFCFQNGEKQGLEARGFSRSKKLESGRWGKSITIVIKYSCSEVRLAEFESQLNYVLSHVI